MTRPDVLVGATGLVGGNLSTQRVFPVMVASRTADTIRGGDLGHVVFSAARAEKWRANADPASDAAHIDELIGLLGSFRAERLTLVSTVDVYRSPRDVDETDEISLEDLHAYGAGRRKLEEAALALHPDVLVVRLPALFGPGLKKNVVFDLLHDNAIERIHPGSAFQYYDLTRLGDDIDVLRSSGVTAANLVTEPVTTAEVVEHAFDRAPLAVPDADAVHYDVRTRHAALFGRSGGYIESKDQVLHRLRHFVRQTVAA